MTRKPGALAARSHYKAIVSRSRRLKLQALRRRGALSRSGGGSATHAAAATTSAAATAAAPTGSRTHAVWLGPPVATLNRGEHVRFRAVLRSTAGWRTRWEAIAICFPFHDVRDLVALYNRLFRNTARATYVWCGVKWGHTCVAPCVHACMPACVPCVCWWRGKRDVWRRVVVVAVVAVVGSACLCVFVEYLTRSGAVGGTVWFTHDASTLCRLPPGCCVESRFSARHKDDQLASQMLTLSAAKARAVSGLLRVAGLHSGVRPFKAKGAPQPPHTQWKAACHEWWGHEPSIWEATFDAASASSPHRHPTMTVFGALHAPLSLRILMSQAPASPVSHTSDWKGGGGGPPSRAASGSAPSCGTAAGASAEGSGGDDTDGTSSDSDVVIVDGSSSSDSEATSSPPISDNDTTSKGVPRGQSGSTGRCGSRSGGHGHSGAGGGAGERNEGRGHQSGSRDQRGQDSEAVAHASSEVSGETSRGYHGNEDPWMWCYQVPVGSEDFQKRLNFVMRSECVWCSLCVFGAVRQ